MSAALCIHAMIWPPKLCCIHTRVLNTRRFVINKACTCTQNKQARETVESLGLKAMSLFPHHMLLAYCNLECYRRHSNTPHW